MPAARKSQQLSFIAIFTALCLILNASLASVYCQGPIEDVNPMIGTTGPSVFDYGGMIPGVTRPFGMTHWTAVTRESKISVCPYNYSDTMIQGFLGTHQPAIWMGDYGYLSLMPSIGDVKIDQK